ncbi:MAG: dienelactone hydrolase family protein [Ectothiorhodospiraceae bacterium]|nr:dienelactone hydrolase family protein [Chromatiales bacterium]MCP5154088.1 dienelactone hydrolase family protein [Ectothiorhodospiraceae bacterium]
MQQSSIAESRHRLEVDDGSIDVFVARPAAGAPLSVMMLGAIWSVTPHIEDVCRRLAHAGFNAFAPCLFRGVGIPALDAAPPVLAQTFVDFDDRRCTRDLRAVARRARDGGLGFTSGPIVPWGFCLGGRFAHYLGAVSEHVDGVICFYGRIRFERQANKPFLPIELAGLVEVPYLGHFAEFDDLIPLTDVAELREALGGRRVETEVHVYEGARHSFFDPARPADHHPQAAETAWARSVDFLRRVAER